MTPAPSPRIVPVILAGGSGTRLWPLSRRAMPKQFLPLIGPTSGYQQALLRVADRSLFAQPIVITNEAFRFFARRQARAVDAEPDILLEPEGRDSAPAIAAATAFALARREPGEIVLTLAADHLIEDADAFRADARLALRAALAGSVVTFGIRPASPHTGYGYIERGAPLGPRVFRVTRFREKPDRKTAERFVAEGLLWNSGNFAFRPDVMRAGFEAHAPAVWAATEASVADARTDLGFVRLEAAAFARAPKISVDHAIMERIDDIAVVEASFPWSDVGTWDSVRLASGPDASGNAVVGDVSLQGARGAYVRSEGVRTAVIGLDDVVVVATADAVLVASAHALDTVKSLVEGMDRGGERTVREHLQSHRPWGWRQEVDRGDRFRVGRVVVEPGETLSLQKHNHRAEHWIVVRGTAAVTIGALTRTVTENQSVYIAAGEVHRLANPGRIPLELIEVQTGSYLEEDDIVRLDGTEGGVPREH